jgi:hypothetical protein
MIHTHNSPEAGLAGVALKIHKFVERAGEASASKLKSGIRSLRKMATEQIRQLMQTLAQAGYGVLEGEGKNLTYKPAETSPREIIPSPIAPPEIDKIDPQMSIASTPEPPPPQTIPTAVDVIDTQPATPIPEALRPGMSIEVWLKQKWVPATYLQALNQSVLSHLTGKLDDGHQVKLSITNSALNSIFQLASAYRVAFADIRIVPPN